METIIQRIFPNIQANQAGKYFWHDLTSIRGKSLNSKKEHANQLDLQFFHFQTNTSVFSCCTCPQDIMYIYNIFIYNIYYVYYVYIYIYILNNIFI